MDELDYISISNQLPASSFQLPASGFQLPASSFQLPASGFRHGLLLGGRLAAES
jgi:hypothetical protein